MKGLLILSVSAGAGHKRAAEALEDAARRRWPSNEIRHVDILDFTGGLYRRGYVRSYLEMVNRAPELWGTLYRARTARNGPGSNRSSCASSTDSSFPAFANSFASSTPISSSRLTSWQRKSSPLIGGADETDFRLVSS